MRVRLLLFAGLREAVGKKEHTLEVEPHTTLAQAVAAAERELPEIARYRGRLLVSLNEARAPEATRLQAGDEIAFLPPMSGGAR